MRAFKRILPFLNGCKQSLASQILSSTPRLLLNPIFLLFVGMGGPLMHEASAVRLESCPIEYQNIMSEYDDADSIYPPVVNFLFLIAGCRESSPVIDPVRNTAQEITTLKAVVVLQAPSQFSEEVTSTEFGETSTPYRNEIPVASQ